MSTPLTKDARGFVDGVVTYLRTDGKAQGVVPKVEAFLGKMTSAAKKEKTAKIKSSVALTANEKKSLEKALGRALGHEVGLECSVDEDLLGGMRVQIGDWVVDTTLKSQLEQMAEMLKQ
jgi:F-type H+-transporting ATPase subunit delta